MGWGGSSYSGVVQRPTVLSEDERHVPWILVICLLVMAMTLILLVLFISSVYVDMNNATNKADAVTNRAVKEINTMRDLRREIYIERRGDGEN